MHVNSIVVFVPIQHRPCSYEFDPYDYAIPMEGVTATPPSSQHSSTSQSNDTQSGNIPLQRQDAPNDVRNEPHLPTLGDFAVHPAFAQPPS